MQHLSFLMTAFFLLVMRCNQSDAQQPDFSMAGFATLNGGTTGGEGGEERRVSTYAQLKEYAEDDTPCIIYVSGTISNGADGGSIKVASNKTILGVGDNTLLNGVGLSIRNAKNIIIRNLRFTMKGITTRVDKEDVYSSTGDEGRPQILTNGGDCIRIYGTSTNVWIDHCEFFSEDPDKQTNMDLYDGLVDITGQAPWITISWSYFHDHHKCHLVGASEKDLFADRKITYHHNYYENIKSRLPLYRGAVGHVFNNYMRDVSNGCDSRAGACLRVERNYFEDSKNTVFTSNTGSAERIANQERNCKKSKPYPVDCKADIPYRYEHVLTESVDSVKVIVPRYAGVGKLKY